MRRRNINRIVAIGMTVLTTVSMAGCQGAGEKTSAEADGPVVLRILENDTAKQQGYLDKLLDAFNEEYKDKGIEVVDANMDEYTDLAKNGPYGYGPDVIYQSNDKLMTYAEDKHIIPLSVEDYDCYQYTPQEAWDAFKLTKDDQTYYCGIPVNIQEPMLFYRADLMPQDWNTAWDDNKNQTPDFLENWNDLYAYSKYVRDHDPSDNKDSQYGCMSSLYDFYMSADFVFSYGGYIFGENEDGSLNSKDIGFGKGNSSVGLGAMRQMASVMNEGCIDDTIKLNRYEKLANGTYFATISTPDTYSLFYSKMVANYQAAGMSEAEAKKTATDNLKMVELPAKLPKDGDLTRDASTMKADDWVDNIGMGGVNGYGISSYTKHRDACIQFVNFATSYNMVKTREEMLGIAPTRSDVAKDSGGVSEMIFFSLSSGKIRLMPSIKAVDRIWKPLETTLGDVAKDPFREKNGEAQKYATQEELQGALDTVSQNVYDAIYTLGD